MEKISVIVPCYNEEESMPLFYDEICKVAESFKHVDLEFIFLNDGIDNMYLKDSNTHDTH